MVFGSLLRVLKARWGLVIFIFLLTLITTIVVSLALPKKYYAFSSIVIDMQGDNQVLGGPQANPYSIQAYLSTQSDIIRSERVVGRVIATLGLDKDPAFLQSIDEHS